MPPPPQKAPNESKPLATYTTPACVGKDRDAQGLGRARRPNLRTASRGWGGGGCSNSRPQSGVKTFGGLEGGGGVGESAGQLLGSLEGGQWVPQHTYLKMIPMTR